MEGRLLPMNAPLFLGSKEEERAFFKKKGIELREEEEKKTPVEEVPQEEHQISNVDIPPLSDEIRRILTRTRLRNDPCTVYMQSDIEFYDHFYTSDDNSEIAQEARNIRRLYKNYPEFLRAIKTRDAYIDHLIETYYAGDEDAFVKGIQSGEVDWIPPMPVYSRHSPDYDYARMGLVMTSNEEVLLSEEDAERVMKETLDERQIDQDNYQIILEYETRRPVQNRISDMDKEQSASYRSTVSDMVSLQKVLSSWYKSEDESKENEETKLFSNTPKAQIDRYNESLLLNLRGNMDKAMKGELEENEPTSYDPYRMVTDPKTGRPMTWKELQDRQLVRLFADAGWQELRVMKQLNVGTPSERARMNKNKKRRKRYQRQAEGIASELGMMNGLDAGSNYDIIAELERNLGGYVD